MPLMWAHAEYIKLLRSLRDGQIFDLPPQTVQRYLVDKVLASCVIWRFGHKSTEVPLGYKLRIELLEPAAVVWSSDEWASNHADQTLHTSLGIDYLDIPADRFPSGTAIVFTFHWASGRWEGTNFQVKIL